MKGASPEGEAQVLRLGAIIADIDLGQRVQPAAPAAAPALGTRLGDHRSRVVIPGSGIDSPQDGAVAVAV